MLLPRKAPFRIKTKQHAEMTKIKLCEFFVKKERAKRSETQTQNKEKHNETRTQNKGQAHHLLYAEHRKNTLGLCPANL